VPIPEDLYSLHSIAYSNRENNSFWYPVRSETSSFKEPKRHPKTDAISGPLYDPANMVIDGPLFVE